MLQCRWLTRCPVVRDLEVDGSMFGLWWGWSSRSRGSAARRARGAPQQLRLFVRTRLGPWTWSSDTRHRRSQRAPAHRQPQTADQVCRSSRVDASVLVDGHSSTCQPATDGLPAWSLITPGRSPARSIDSHSRFRRRRNPQIIAGPSRSRGPARWSAPVRFELGVGVMSPTATPDRVPRLTPRPPPWAASSTRAR